MCDFRSGDLILSYDVQDLIADELVRDIRQGKISGVTHDSALKERLRSLGETEDLPWKIHLLHVDEGDEVLMINTLHQEYSQRSSQANARGMAQFRPKPHSKTQDSFHVSLNSILSLSGPRGTAVDFTFSPTHQAYIKKLGCAQFTSGTGAGVRVAIVDSGLDSQSPIIASKRVNVLNGGPNDVDDLVGHGTTMAAIVNSIAPDAELWIYRVASAPNVLNEWDVMTAVSGARGAHVINLSLGFGLPDRTCTTCGRQSQSSRSAVFENILSYVMQDARCVVAAAAGNKGVDELDFPARYPDVLAVGSVDTSENVSSFSSFGTKATLNRAHQNLFFLPGGQLDPATRMVTEKVGTTKNPPVDCYGTSEATAYASGCVALLMSARTRKLDRAALLNHLQGSTIDVQPQHVPAKHGNGVVRLTTLPP